MTLTINRENYLKLLDEAQLIPKVIETEAEFEQKQYIQNLVNNLLKQIIQDKSLDDIIQDLQTQAKNNGLTQEILKRPKFNKYVSLESRNKFITKFKLESEQITITETITICRDSKDNKFLELALSGNADFIITGDQDLLVLNPVRGIQIITVNQFLNLD